MNTKFRGLVARAFCILVCMLFLDSFVLPVPFIFGGDLPTGIQDQIGSSTVTVGGDVMTHTTGDMKYWGDAETFDIGADKTLNSIGPNSNAVMLYNVTGPAGSEIAGIWNSNCNQFLLNPNGILFTETAQLNLGSLVASTLTMSKEDFLSGKYVLSGADLVTLGNNIINEGAITTTGPGGVTFAGGAIKNAGTINAHLGTVNLVAGREVTLNIAGDGSIQAAVTQDLLDNVYDSEGRRVAIGVDNVGEITADGGEIRMEVGAVQDVFDTLINQEGVVRAGSMVERNGKIVLISNDEGIIKNTGTMTASAIEDGANGGTIEMRGSKVGQFGEVRADGKGSGNGGTITLYANDTVALSSGSITTANAEVDGSGGDITVYSPDTALFWSGARIEAKGGSNSGDGGFVEVSGKENVYIRGMVDASATNGTAGTFLIDPTDIEVVNPTVNTVLTDDGDGTFTCTADANDVLDTTLEGYLNAGTNVTLDTSDYDAVHAGTGNITISTAIDVVSSTAVATLTLYAANNIIVNAAIDASGSSYALNVALHANQVVANAADDGDVNAGDVDINAAITTNGGSFTSTGVAFDNTGGAITTAGGAVDLTGHTGAVTIGAAIDTSGAAGGAISITGSSINLAIASALTTNTANIALNSPVTLGADTTLSTGAGVAGNVTFSSTIDGAQALTVSAGTGTITFGGVIGGTTPINSLSASANTINLNGTGITTADVAGNNVTLTGAVVLGADVSIDTDQTTNDGNVTFSSTVDGAQALTVTTGAGDITISGVTGGTTGLTALSLSGYDISIANIGTTSAEGITGNTTVTASNQLTFTGTIYKANTQSYTAATGNNFLVNAGAPTTFNSSNDTITFNIGTILLANGSDLSMNTDSGLGNIALGPISGTNSEDVTLDAGTGNVYVWAIGAGGYINTVTIDGAEIHLYDNITTSDSSGNDVTLTGAVKLENSLTIDTDNTNADGNIVFSGTASTISGVSSARTLTLQAGSGDVTLGGAIGAGNLISTLTVTSTGTTAIGANITTLNANVDFTGATNIVLGTDVVIDTGAGVGNVLFSNAGANSLSGGYDLRIDAGTGNVTFDNATQLTSLAVNDGASGSGATAVTFNGVINIPGAVNVIAGGDITVATAGSIAAGNITLDTKTNDLGNDVVINGNVSTTGDNTITITSGDAVNIAQAAAAAITSVNGNIDIDADTSVLLGSTNPYAGQLVTTGTGNIDIDAPTDFTMAGTGTQVNSGGAVNIGTSTELTTITTAGSGITAVGNITANADDAITLGTGGVIESTAGSVALTVSEDNASAVGTVAVGANVIGDNVTITASDADAGTATINVTSAINNNRGGITFEPNDGTLNIDSNITAQDFIALNGGAAIQLAANLTATDNNITVNDALTLDGGTPTITATSGNVTFSSTINGAYATTVSAPSGTATFTGIVGGTTPLASLTVSADTASLNANISTDNGGNVDFTGTDAVTLTSTVTIDTELNNDANAGDILFKTAGTINGAQTLSLNASTTGVFTGGAVQLGTLGNTTALTSLTVTNQGGTTDGTTTLYGNITTSGAIDLTAADDINLAHDVTLVTTNSAVDLGTGDNIDGAYALTINAGSGAVTLGRIGAATDITGLTITSGTLTSADMVEVDGTLTVTASGAVDIDGEIDVDGVSGDVSITTSSTLALDANLTVDGASTVTLSSGTSAMTIGTAGNATVTGINGNIKIIAGNLTLGTGGNNGVVTTATGSGNIKVDSSGVITVNTGSSMSSGGYLDIDPTNVTNNGTLNGDEYVSIAATGTVTNEGTISTDNAGSYITINSATIAQNGSITTPTGGSEYVTLAATGAITDDGTGLITTDVLNVTDAVTVGASGNPLNTAISTLNESGVDGATYITETNGITLNNVDVDGAVTVTATLGDIAATTVTTTNDDVTLTSTAGAITVGAITAGSGTVTLNAHTTINDVAADTTADITAATVDLDAIDGIGNTAALELANATTIDADTTGAGAAIIDLSNDSTQATTLQSFTTAGTAANITFSQVGGGALTVTSAVTTDGNITISADDANLTAATITAGGSGNDVTLTTTNSGNVYVDNVTANDQIAITSAGLIGESGSDSTADLTAVTATLRSANGIGTSDAIETNITNLDVINSISGDIQITEVVAGGALNINQAAQQTSGNINIQTGDGTLTVVAGQSGVTAVESGTITLIAGDSGGSYNDDLAINDTVTSNTGKITLTSSGNDVTFGAGGDVTSTSGEIEVNATNATGAGVITMADGTVLNAGSGIIDLNAYGNITLGSVVTTSTSNDAVNLNSAAGGIVDGGDTNVDVVAASGRLVIDAVTGVGSAGNIETTVDSIDIDNTTSGNIDINETNAITVIKIAQGASGTVNLDAGGTITLATTANGGVGVTATSGTVELDATGTTSDVLVNNVITTTGGDIDISADNDVTFANVGDVTSGGGNVSVTADANGDANGSGGAIFMADVDSDSTVIDAGTGTITLLADENITLGGLTTANTANSSVIITSGNGSIVDGGDTAVDIDANTTADTSGARLTAKTGIGTDANALDTTIETLSATTTTGDIHIINTGDLQIIDSTVNGAQITGGSSGDNITIIASSPLTVAADVVDAGGGNILLAAEGTTTADDLTINDVITASGGNGNITLYAGDTIAQNSVAVTAAGSGTITYYAGVDYNSGTPQAGLATGVSDIVMDATATTVAGTGNVTMTAPDSIQISSISTSGNVSLTADDSTYITSDSTGAITEVLATELANITAVTATLRAATGIGSADDIDTNITTLDAVNSTSGNLLVTEIDTATGDLDVNQATQTALGNLLVQTLDGTLTVVADQSGVATTTGTLTLIAGDADTGYTDDLVINDTVTTTTGNITLTSSGDDVTFGAGGDVTTTSGLVDVNAESGVGLGEGVITMADGAVIDSGTAQIDMDAYGDITLGGLTTTYTADDAVAVTSVAGGIIDGGDTDVDIVANTASATADLDAATGIGSANALETSIYNLEATNTTSGDIKIIETDAINLVSVVDNVTGGDIDVTAGGNITTTTVTSGASTTLHATTGNIADSGGAALLTAGAISYLKADNGIIGTIANHYNVDINGDLWVKAGAETDEVSAIMDGIVKSTAATERVEILLPAPPGLVILNNHLMGGSNYGSGSTGGSILSRGYGFAIIEKVNMFNFFYGRALSRWGYKITAPWALSEANFLDDSFLNGPPVIMDGSAIGVNILPRELLIAPAIFQPKNYYIIRQIKK